MFNFYGDPETNESGYSLVPEGKVKLRVTDVEEKTSAGGDNQVVVDLADTQSDATLRHWVTFIPAGQKGHGIAKHWLKAMTGSCDGDNKIIPEDWKGKEIDCVVYHDKHEGKIRAKIDISSIEALEGAAEEIPF